MRVWVVHQSRGSSTQQGILTNYAAFLTFVALSDRRDVEQLMGFTKFTHLKP